MDPITVNDLTNTIVGQAVEIERLRTTLAAREQVISALVQKQSEAQTPAEPAAAEGQAATAPEGTA